jgi:hypothetical protein
MTGFEQIKRGVVAYINQDLVPVVPKALGIGLAAFGPVVIESKVRELAASGLFSGTNLVSTEGVDIDEVMRLIKPAANGKWPIQMYGFTFSETDLDKLYRYIKEA